MASPVPPTPSAPAGSRVIPGSGSSSPTTPQTNQPPSQATEGGAPAQTGASVSPPASTEPTREQRLIASQDALLREQQQELARLRQSQRGLEGRVQAIETPPPSREDQNARFWKDPVGVVGDLINSELKKTVDPINQMLHAGRAETEYDRMKKDLKGQFEAEWPYIEGEIDRFVTAAAEAGNKITPELLNVAALASTGAMARGLLPGPSNIAPAPSNGQPPVTPPQAPRNDMTTPPHLRPSAPPAPSNERGQPTQRRELSENERRLARERNMSPEQFLDWLEVPPDQVVHSQIGRPPKP